MLHRRRGIAGDDLDADAGGLQPPDRRRRRRLGRIDEDAESGEHADCASSAAHRPGADGREVTPGQTPIQRKPCVGLLSLNLRKLRASRRRRADAPLPSRRSTAVASAMISSGAPLTISSRRAGVLGQHRDAAALEVEGHVGDLAPAGKSRCRRAPARMASSSGLRMRAFEAAVDRGQFQDAAAVGAVAPGWPTSAMRASVSVPVLSVHSTLMAPRSWMAASRFTTTLRAAMRTAPRDSVTVMIIGSSSGVMPTASATANRKDSSTGRDEGETAPAARTAPERR